MNMSVIQRDRSTEQPLLELRDLTVEYLGRGGTVYAVRGLDLEVYAGETVGLVGESGSGKSAASSAVMGVLQTPGRVSGGDIRWKGQSLTTYEGQKKAESLRGVSLSMIFQNPMFSLDPLATVGSQVVEVLRQHTSLSRKAAWSRAVELFGLVGISAPSKRVKQYPHELSGGMRQRVMIAMALACDPELLIADEPTTALDVTVQLQIIKLLKELQERLGLAILLISHDLGLIAETCDRVVVMYAGRVCEVAETESLFSGPRHPYTVGLLNATPRLDRSVSRLPAIEGTTPDMTDPPSGCAFHPRCPIAVDRCKEVAPELKSVDGETRMAACFRSDAVHLDLFAADGIGPR